MAYLAKSRRPELFFALLLGLAPAATNAAPKAVPAEIAPAAKAPQRASRLQGFSVRSVINAAADYTQGLKASLRETFTRKFGGFSRAYATAQKLSDERLKKMPPQVRANLAGALLKSGLGANHATRAGASEQFMRVVTVQGTEPGPVLDLLARLDVFDDATKIAKRLRGPAQAQFTKLLEETRAKPGDWAAFRAFADSATHTRERAGSEVEPLINGSRYFPALLHSIDNAKKSILMEKFAFHGDEVGHEVAQHMEAAAKRGVYTHELYDRTGSLLTDPKMMHEQQEAGEHVIQVNPERALAGEVDHRKLVVVDQKEGYIGGMNIGKEYRDVWHDVQARVTGPAVADMAGLIARQTQAKGAKLPRGLRKSIRRAIREADAAAPPAPNAHSTRVVAHEGFDDEHEKLLYLRAIDTSTERVYLENPYMADPDVITHLTAAARRGADVRVVLPGRSDSKLLKIAQRANYQKLLGAGVRVYEYLGKDRANPVMSHGKVGLFDRAIVTVGSTNLDERSLRNNDEANVWAHHPELSQRLEKELFQQDFKDSREIRSYRPTRWQRIEDRAIKAVIPLL